MKLIVEFADGRIYMYMESDERFDTIEPHRSMEMYKLDHSILDGSCDIESNEDCQDGNYIVFDIKESAHE